MKYQPDQIVFILDEKERKPGASGKIMSYDEDQQKYKISVQEPGKKEPTIAEYPEDRLTTTIEISQQFKGI